MVWIIFGWSNKLKYSSFYQLTQCQDISTIIVDLGLQTTGRGPNSAREAISSGQKHSVKYEKIYIDENLVNLVECNILQNNLIL